MESAFNAWLDTFLQEKGIDLEEYITVLGHSGENHMPLLAVVNAIKKAPKHEQSAIKDTMVKLDFNNAPIKPYLAWLAKAIAQ
ncbi:hypothetical protein [Ectothiorhodospira shaposhnikovii]|uniref:hypothetical protein n=1 Tax=Ectothiorhodospira shaposhnikovii TaxID=1054 RepID=UPI001EE8638C|nr:hypothetical protein [Ectothiorhodospira shaposhnikovii]MCG5512808.1 hypothetical protein [Ectothiorhodospira shaposhnikovii]